LGYILIAKPEFMLQKDMLKLIETALSSEVDYRLKVRHFVIASSFGSYFLFEKLSKLIHMFRFKDFKTSMSILEMLKANLLLRVLQNLLYSVK
jgi:hypothetical protein